jgi:FkbM family methyltransferase
MGYVSYAQAGEDVLLWRALASRVHHDVGFYIDVGAYDPDMDSVTRTFYDCGWCGINVEPVQPFFEAFVEKRPRDINLQAAVSDHTGKVTFHEVVGEQLGTVVDEYATKHSQSGRPTRSYDVDCLTLTEICDRYVGARPIHFLKIDVEGHEGAALRGMDFKRYRPWVLVVEATEPNRVDIPTHAEWDRLVRRSGYIYAGTTLPNRYYVAREHRELAGYFKVQPDSYERAHHVAERERLAEELELARQEVKELKRFAGPTLAATQPLKTEGEHVFIGCTTDKRFVEPTAVMLSSVDLNGEVPEAVLVVCGFGLDEADKAKLRIGAGRLADQMRLFDVTREMLRGIEPDGFTEMYPAATLGKLLIGEFLRGQDGRLLTLDSDMIVNSSLRPLVELNMNGEYFAAVHDPPRVDDPNYFNSGLTLCDLNMYRHHDVGMRSLRYVAEHRPYYPDQDALNAIVGDSWHRLNPAWNSFYSGTRAFTLEDYEGAKVAHFAGWKPWDHVNHPATPLYNRYLSRYRKLLATHQGMGDGPARDLIATAYEVLLGRELESVSVVRDRAHLPSVEILKGVLDSSEFKDNVLAALLSGDPFPHGRFPGSPSLRQRLWAADHFGGDGGSKAGMEAAQSWRGLLELIWAQAKRLNASADDGSPSEHLIAAE